MDIATSRRNVHSKCNDDSSCPAESLLRRLLPIDFNYQRTPQVRMRVTMFRFRSCFPINWATRVRSSPLGNLERFTGGNNWGESEVATGVVRFDKRTPSSSSTFGQVAGSKLIQSIRRVKFDFPAPPFFFFFTGGKWYILHSKSALLH